MSRSRKRYPHYADNRRGCHEAKRQAAKSVRRAEGTWNGASYKRLYCRWNIHDWICTHYDFNKNHQDSWKEDYGDRWWQMIMK